MKYAVFRKKMSPVGEYASSLVFLTLPLSIFNQTTLGIVSEKGGIARISLLYNMYNMPLLLKRKYSLYTLRRNRQYFTNSIIHIVFLLRNILDL